MLRFVHQDAYLVKTVDSVGRRGIGVGRVELALDFVESKSERAEKIP